MVGPLFDELILGRYLKIKPKNTGDMKTIIALTNFSESSHNAVHYAADMCSGMHANLVLIHIIQLPVSFDMPISEYDYSSIRIDAEKELLALKAAVEERTRGAVAVSTRVLAGTMLHEIEEACESKKPFLVIIGTERRNWAERFIFGSNTFNSVKNLHYPVLVVPQDAAFKPIERIVLASDFKDIDEVPLEMLRELVAVFNASVEVVHVTENPEEELNTSGAFAHLLKQLEQFNPHTHFITGYNVEQAINDYAVQHEDDLVIVISRKHSFFDALIHKSQSRQITLNPQIPVLAVAE